MTECNVVETQYNTSIYIPHPTCGSQVQYVFKRRRILRVVTETTAFGNSMAGALLPPIFLSLPWTSKHFYSKLQLDLYPTGSKSAVGIVPRTSR